MSRFCFLFIVLCLLFLSSATAQVDTVTVEQPPPRSVPVVPVQDNRNERDSLLAIQMLDSFSTKPVVDSGWKAIPGIPLSVQIMKHHPYYGFGTAPLTGGSERRKTTGKEMLFYILVVFLLVFALLKAAFSKYFSDLLRLFFRTTIKQRQIREQLMQTPLPSLLFNGFFIAIGGLYVNFMLLHFHWIEKEDFWLYYAYCCLGLTAIYSVKFVGLKILGWIFGVRAAADAYIFVVFIINKVIGIFLLPFIVMLAFMEGTGYLVALVLSWTGVGILILYRFILTYAAIRNQVKFNPFQFFLYLLAFEIAPLLLIYKLLLLIFK